MSKWVRIQDGYVLNLDQYTRIVVERQFDDDQTRFFIHASMCPTLGERGGPDESEIIAVCKTMRQVQRIIVQLVDIDLLGDGISGTPIDIRNS